jgi:hypothetical protein
MINLNAEILVNGALKKVEFYPKFSLSDKCQTPAPIDMHAGGDGKHYSSSSPRAPAGLSMNNIDRGEHY